MVDNSVLSALERASALDLLPQLFSEVVTPPAVAYEFERYRVGRTIPAWVRIIKPGFAPTYLSLGRGEAQAIVLAKEREALLASDDRLARLTARREGLQVVGTFGLVRLAYEKGVIPRPALRALVDRLTADLYAPPWLRRWVLAARKRPCTKSRR